MYVLYRTVWQIHKVGYLGIVEIMTNLLQLQIKLYYLLSIYEITSILTCLFKSHLVNICGDTSHIISLLLWWSLLFNKLCNSFPRSPPFKRIGQFHLPVHVNASSGKVDVNTARGPRMLVNHEVMIASLVTADHIGHYCVRTVLQLGCWISSDRDRDRACGVDKRHSQLGPSRRFR